MVALPQPVDDLDHDDGQEDDFHAGLMAAAPIDSLPPTILERLAAARPGWHALAACRGRSDLSWFDPDQETAARTVCATCPVRAQCGEYGAGEQFGVWGGQDRERLVQRRKRPRSAA